MIDYNKALYRRDNKGNPCVWYAEIIDRVTLKLYYGILGKTITTELATSFRRSSMELETRIKAKQKSGYLLLSDVTDQTQLPVEESHIKTFLDTYLPHDRQSSSGAMLPMLAKVYDNTDNKMFKDSKTYIAQPKLNGLRCAIGATKVGTDMFNPSKLTFQSRDGIYWNSLDHLEKYLLSVIPRDLYDKMLNEGYLLDGELYLYGEPVSEINSIVKNTKHVRNREIQFWCYDIAVPEMSQTLRLDILENHFEDFQFTIRSKEDHEFLQERFVMITSYECNSGSSATMYRNLFISWDFEGLILRNKEKSYQYGKRNSAMWKYKATVDGKFTILDIVSEGSKRPDIPLLLLKNDINDATFSVHVNGSFDYQKSILVKKEEFIGKLVYATYCERSGVQQVPFHVKEVTIILE